MSVSDRKTWTISFQMIITACQHKFSMTCDHLYSTRREYSPNLENPSHEKIPESSMKLCAMVVEKSCPQVVCLTFWILPWFMTLTLMWRSPKSDQLEDFSQGSIPASFMKILPTRYMCRRGRGHGRRRGRYPREKQYVSPKMRGWGET